MAFLQAAELCRQTLMVEVVNAGQARFAFGAGEAAAIDGFSPGRDAGQAAQPGVDPGGGHAAWARDAVAEHVRVQFPWVPVEVCDRAGVFRRNKDAALVRDCAKQLIYKRIFRPADGLQGHTEGLAHVTRIEAAGMRRGKNDRRRHFFRYLQQIGDFIPNRRRRALRQNGRPLKMFRPVKKLGGVCHPLHRFSVCLKVKPFRRSTGSWGANLRLCRGAYSRLIYRTRSLCLGFYREEGFPRDQDIAGRR